MKKVLVLITVLALGTMAQAYTVDVPSTAGGLLHVDVAFIGTYAAFGGQTVDAFQVNLRGDTAADIVIGVDVSITPDAGTAGLYQSGIDGALSDTFTPDMQVASALPNKEWDTHFLLNAGGGDWSAGNAVAVEDNDFQFGNDGAIDHGLGTSLSVLAFVTASATAQDLAFAYVTVPRGSFGSAWLKGGVANGVGDKYMFDDLTAGGVQIGPIPEPATLAFLAIGGLSLLARKRRS